ncbi:MAG: phage holin family protein [Rubritalea sp.]|uniref:phage holin family protein n=1 Tax=Rubritalea sp. TaxID=2109375 RepID=UPI0032425470
MRQTEPSPPERDFTIKDTLDYLKESGSDYLRAKTELASIEAKEAANEAVKRAILGASLAFFGLFSYILLLTTLVGIFSELLEGKLSNLEQYVDTWPVVTFGFFLVHLLFVFIFLDKLKTTSKKTLFAHTKAEIEKDKQWLQQIKPNKEN